MMKRQAELRKEIFNLEECLLFADDITFPKVEQALQELRTELNELFLDQGILWKAKAPTKITERFWIPAACDIALLEDPVSGTFSLEVNTDYKFRDRTEEAWYFQSLLGEFTAWMRECGYSTKEPITMPQLFSMSFESAGRIEDLYARFKFLVRHYYRRELSHERFSHRSKSV